MEIRVKDIVKYRIGRPDAGGLGLSARRAAVIAAIGFIAIAAFQVALALGALLGLAAWGGRKALLSSELRLGSGGAAIYLVAAAAVVLGRTERWGARVPLPVFRFGIWFLVAQMSLTTLANLASPSPWERYLMGALSLILVVLCTVVARAPRTHS